ncbi:protein kinase [Streptomyces sp. NPDC091368]|uniref:protein kinase n=1 Tax=Streptomyces sp. NPDC091368 TaxID=3365993 RepID=UPI0037F90A92
MDDYAGRVLADRYRLPLPPSDADAYEPVETRAFDTYSGQEVLVRQVPLPEFVDAEVLDGQHGPGAAHGGTGQATRRPAEPVVRRAIEAAQAAAQIPDHPLLDQVFDVFAEAGSLWIVSERVAARPLAALLAERPLNPYRAAEIGADVLTALRALHAHGWVHRNITARTVLVCDDGRVVLSGLAVGAAEEALCGYAPVPDETDAFAPPPEGEGPEETDPETEGDDSEGYGTGEYAEEEYVTGEYGAEEYRARGYEPEPYEPEYALHRPETYEPEAYEPESYEPASYQPETHAADVELYGTGTETGAETGTWTGAGAQADPATEPLPPYGSQEYGPEAYEVDTYEVDPHEVDPHEVDPHEADGHGEPGTEHGAEPYPAAPDPYGSDPYGSDPYGRAAPAAETQPVATPPTADVRAARAGAIAAYRAGARAAARLGETGALPVQRPAPPETPGPPPPPPTAPASGAPEPQWWARVADEEDDEDDGDGDEPYGTGRPGAGPPPPRVMLAGSWSDGPHAARDGSGPIPAGGSPVLPGSGRPALPAGYTAANPEPKRLPVPAGPRDDAPLAIPAQAHRGPTTRLAAERARQTRIAVVGAVTERWAPEQAGPVHDNWRLAPPIGPATDLWALGALLYRAVQGHAPYPEDSAGELVQLVCAEPPAFAEECGPLRPVVESLLRQDPTERPDFEELRGWLRSLVRSAPEPDAGLGVVPLPSFDEARLPIVRRRGELVRRWRGKAGAGRHRHKGGKDVRPGTRYEERRAPDRAPATGHEHEHDQEFDQEYGQEYGPAQGQEYGQEYGPAQGQEYTQEYGRPRAPREHHEEFRDGFREKARGSSRAPGSPRSLGRTLLILVFLLLGGAVAYAVLFLPGDGEQPTPRATPTAGPASSAPGTAPPTSGPPATAKPSADPTTGPATAPPPADPAAPALAAGYELRRDPEGFRVGVAKGWRRSPINDAGQVRYTNGDFTLIVVPGRDAVRDNGADPLEYQNVKERELEPYRSSSWSQAEKTRRVDIGRTPTAEGSYTWPDSTGRMVFVRNLALIDGGRYHVVQVIGPESERDKVSEIYDQATKGFRPGR